MKTTNYLAGLAAITMTFTGVAAPISAYADDISTSASIDYATYGDFVYIIKADKTAEIVEYNGTDENVVIPAELNGYTITGISGWSGKPTNSHPLGVITGAFKNNKTIKTVVIPDTVKYIDDESFYGCTALESVMFGNGVEEIGDYAFENCTSLSKVYIPVSVKKIGAEAFGYTFGSELTLNKNFSMTCSKDSAAEKYAKENGITYDTYQVKIDELAVSGIKDKEYTGKPVTQNIVIKNGNVVLDDGTDYTVTYSANTKVGTVEVTITGTGSYIGEIKSSFDILPAKQQIQKLETRFKGFFIDWAQKGSATGYEIEYSTNADFKDSTVKKLTANKPDTLTISGLTAGNKYYVRVRSYTNVGENVYYGAWSDSKNITTAKYDITKSAISGISTKTYTGKNITQSVKVKYNGKTLKSGTDYTVSYSNNKKVGTATVKITGKGQYGGTVSKTFKINPAKQKIQKLTAKSKAFFIDWAQKGSATGYDVEYSVNANMSGAVSKHLTANKPDTLTVSGLAGDKVYYVRVRSYTNVNGKVYYGAWSDIKSIKTANNDITKATVSGISTKAFTGKAITQNVTVKVGNTVLKNGTDYTVSYSNNKKVGKATVKITGKGKYGGVITKTFKINPAKQEIQKLTAKSKAFFVDWAQKGSATGYEIQYATNSKFTGAKKVTITNNKTDKTTVSKLSANKKYYVRVRSYTTVGGTKYYGAWSAVKNVTTKK